MKVLVVVDMQNDFISGSLGSKEAQAIVPNVKNKIKEAVKNGDLIIYTRDTHFESYMHTREGQKLPVEHCISGTKGWRIPDELLPPGDYDKCGIIDKFTFGDLELPGIIRSMVKAYNDGDDTIEEVELVGLCTDICVVSNALILKAAMYDRTDISVDAKCCAGVTPATHEAALTTMQMCQINVRR
jgi:nicotinamidase-related amidase